MSDKPGFLDSFSPWTSRSNTPKAPDGGGEGNRTPTTNKGAFGQSKPTDHSVSHHHPISARDYPSDCPKSNLRWFYAVDAPKRKPLAIEPQKEPKVLPQPKKYAAFSARDSRSIEQAFQSMAVEDNTKAQEKLSSGDIGDAGHTRAKSLGDAGSSKNTTINDSTDTEKGGLIKVPVNEDYLFDVDVEHRELAPTYWLGPIYDVRRGSWFYQEGSALRPCDENLASQLEEGYLKIKPWRNSSHVSQGSTTQTDPTGGEDGAKKKEAPEGLSETSEKAKNERSIPQKFELQTQRLFGTYMSSVVTYQDSTTAWILTDDFLSRMSSTVYQRFAGGGHLGGNKVVRGYSEPRKATDSKKEPDPAAKSGSTKEPFDELRRKPANPGGNPPDLAKSESAKDAEPTPEPRIRKLERQMSSIIASPTEDRAQQEAEARKRDEDEIREDYVDADGQDQGREVEHLILVTHGIGQRLGLRMESVNFIHDVNVLRKTLKSVYDASPDLQALNNEVDKLPKNCRVQVLPVVWRHLLDFPRQSFKQNTEKDLTDVDYDEEYPSLENITVEGVPAIRQLISDLALDILLYQSAYREHIASIVQQECNRVYELFIQRNPSFHGKVSLIGHSLGSAILFDILCQQPDASVKRTSINRGRRSSQRSMKEHKTQDSNLGLKFEVEDFYCLGSPLGLYQMLKGRKIAGRPALTGLPNASLLNPDALEDPFLGPASIHATDDAADLVSIGISSPKCGQLFNIFHPADPIAYRIEPLVSNAMSPLKPQPLPYTKKGIFGVQGQGLSNIGAMVGQSVSGMWTNLTSGVASSLLNRSLGLTGDGQISSTQSSGPPLQHRRDNSLSAGGGTNITAGGVISPQERNEEHPPTLLDSEKVTLYAEFEKQRRSAQSDQSRDLGESAEWLEAERRSRRLRLEEAKIRALNSNGRVDFSIQEGVFDISLIASIASHLSYWADEDVSHFMISQLLSRQRVIKR